MVDSVNVLFQNLFKQFNGENWIVTTIDPKRDLSFIKRNAEKINNRFPLFTNNINLKNPHQNPILLFYHLKISK